ncbi:MAG: O-antigen ligase family protein [Candidatus Scalindua sp.]|nr:O-antigen ligase family protein [Candidatus Scalindua sp.]MCR4343125.1 O-antigen ligase family protein [Candidatus Scalindua sp.]
MANGAKQTDLSLIFLLIGILVIGCIVGFATTVATPIWVLVAVSGLIVFLVSFVWPPIGLYLLVFSMLLSPEFGERQTQGEGFTIRMDDILLVVLALSWFIRSAIKKELGIFPKTPLNKGITAYILLCLFSTVMGGIYGKINVIGLFFVLKYFEYFIIYFMAVNFINTRKQVITFLVLLLITCAIASSIGIVQIPAGERVTAPFEGREGEPGTFGGYLILMVSVCIGLLLTIKSVKVKALLSFLTIMVAVLIVATESRATWLGVPFMYLCFLALSKRRFLLVGAFLVFVAMGPVILPQSAIDRFSGTFKRERGYEAKVGGKTLALDSSATQRVQSWQGILRDLRFHPILGYGITGYWFVDAQYFRTLIELGIVGLIIFLLFLYQIGKFLLRVYYLSNDNFVQGLSMGVFAGFVCLLVHGIGSNTFIIVRIMEPFWFLMGLVVILYNLEMEKQEKLQSGSLIIQETVTHGLHKPEKV